MKRIVLFLLLAIAFSSCVTRKKCMTRFPPEVKIVTKDSVVYREKITVRDTTITVKLPADTIEVSVPVEVQVKVDPVTVESKCAKASAWIKDGKLNIRLTTKDAEIQIHIDSARTEATYWKERYNTDQKTITVKEKVVPGIYRASLWICVGLVLAIIGYLSLRKLFK
jgi:hypothetical protein